MASKYPHISAGLGKLTPKLWARLMDMLKWYESHLTQLNQTQPGVKKPYLLAKITANDKIGSDWRWKYAWTEVVLDASDGTSFTDKTSGLPGTVGTDYALNLCEASNDGTDVGPGVETNGADYPAGFDPMAIGQLTSEAAESGGIDVVVPMFLMRDDAGNLRYFFALANAHDGTCA